MAESHANQRLARRLWQALSRGDPTGAAGCMLPDVRWRTSGDNPFAGESKSAADFLTLLASFAEAVDDLRMELCDIFASDRGAVLHYQAVAERGPDLLECEYLILMHIEDGLIVDAVTIALDTDRNDAFWRKAAAARSG